MSNASWAYIPPSTVENSTDNTVPWTTIHQLPTVPLHGTYPYATVRGAGGGPLYSFHPASALYYQHSPLYPTPPSSSTNPSLSASVHTPEQANTQEKAAGSFSSGSGNSHGVWVQYEEEQGQGQESTSSSVGDQFSFVSSSLSSLDAASRAFGLPLGDDQQLQLQQISPVRLSTLDINELSPTQAVFYFGVLAVQTLLLPRFQLTRSHDGHDNRKWGGMLTMYGHTIVEHHVFGSESETKTALCREALERLVSHFPGWNVPDEPEDFPSKKYITWNWVETLDDYCVQNGLRKPNYKSYTTNEGQHRHEVELERNSFFGFRKGYPNPWESKKAAAHMALHSMVVYGNGVPYSFPGPFSLQRSNESLLAHVPRVPPGEEPAAVAFAIAMHDVPVPGRPKREAEDRDMSSTAHGDSPKRRRTRGRRCRGRRQTPKAGKNVNLLPLAGNKLPDIKVNVPKEEKRWKLTPGELQEQLKDQTSQVDRLEKACILLSLQPPEIRVDRLDGRLVETHGEYTAAAYFQGDPFLTRAGAIGTVKGVQPSKGAVHEACAGKVVAYLIKIVNEDTVLEAKAAAERAGPGLWRENVGRIYEEKGWLGSFGDETHG